MSHAFYRIALFSAALIVGFGLTDASDRFQLKLILSRDLNRPR